jgi:hypothetical protein
MVLKIAGVLLLLASGSTIAQMPDLDERERRARRGAKADEAGDAAAGPGPRIFTPTPVLDLGEIMQGETASGKFVIENRGTATLQIERIRPSCGCTTVKLSEDQKTIAPGGKVEIEAKFNSRGRQGQQKKYVTITSNDPKTRSLRVTLQAMIKTLIEVRPGPILNVQEVRPGTLIDKHVDLLPDSGETVLTVESVDINKTGFRHTEEILKDGERTGVRLRFSVDESAPFGTLNPTVTVNALVGEKKAKQTIRVRGRVAGDLRFNPVTVQSTRPTPRGQTLREVSVQANDGKPFEILRAEGGPHLEVRVKDVRDQRDYRISVAPAATAPDGPFGTWLVIHTSKPSQPVIRIPTFVNVAPRLSVSPPAVLLTAVGQSPAESRRVYITSARGKPLNVTEATSDNPFIKADVINDPKAPQARKTVEIRLNGTVPPGNHEAMVTITTDLEGAGQIRVPVTIYDPSTVGQRRASADEAKTAAPPGAAVAR